jgi:hypothetical protein
MHGPLRSFLFLLPLGCSVDDEDDSGSPADIEISATVSLGEVTLSESQPVLVLAWEPDLSSLEGMGLWPAKSYRLEINDATLTGTTHILVYASSDPWEDAQPDVDSYLYEEYYSDTQEPLSLNVNSHSDYSESPVLYTAYERQGGSGDITGEATAIFMIETSDPDTPDSLSLSVEIVD